VLGLAARLVLGLVLATSAVLKLASPASSRAALSTFEIEGERLRWVAWLLLIGVELGLAAEVIAGSEGAAWLAAGFLTLFAAALVGAILRGRAGAPCACFGSRSTVGWRSVGRNLALAACFAALPFLPQGTPSTDEWLALGLIVALLACLGLGIAVLALAREVGMLRLRLGPASALEIPEEGPELGHRIDLVDRFPDLPPGGIGLVVFTSEGCRVCRGLAPAISSLASELDLAVEIFDEVADADVWGDLAIPGSPYALAVDSNGTLLAKGTFNNLAQLESVLATAGRRRASMEARFN
jgi:Methylamine utilisation protein MauE